MKAIVVVPTFNERDNIEKLVKQVMDTLEDIHILIVDDNSPDGTGDVVDNLASQFPNELFVIHRKKKMGLGSAYVEGFRYALGKGYDFILEMDADFSHNPKYLPELLRKAENYDLVLGSRYIDGINVVNWPFKRVVLSLWANKYVQFVTRMHYSDCLGGFKCFKRKVLEEIGLDKIISSGYVFQMEMLYRAHKKKFSVCEVPIVFYDRSYGKSKLDMKVVIEAFINVWRLKFIVRVRG